MLKVDDVLEILSVPLLGVIPESPAVLQALLSSPTQEVGNAQSPIELISMEMDNP